MELYLRIIITLLVLSWILFIIMFIVLSTYELFTKSLFFSFGGRFSILGVEFEDQNLYTGLGFFFFFNSLFGTLNSNVIAPVFNRLIFSHPSERECHSKKYRIDNATLYTILIFYDLWLAVKSLFNLLGILSNLGFFIATSIGFLIGDIVIKYIYINDPYILNFSPNSNKCYTKIDNDDSDSDSYDSDGGRSSDSDKTKIKANLIY
jgi:hypothetical protein